MTVQVDHNESHSIGNPDTNNATYIDVKDVDATEYFSADYRLLNKKAHYRYLNDLNAGRCLGLNRYNDQDITREMALDHIAAISSQLDLTSKERSQARNRFMALDRERLGLKTHLVAYSVCCYVVEQNDRNEKRRCHPNISADKVDDLFQDVAQSLNLKDKNIMKTYGKIQNRLDDTTIPVIRERERTNHGLPGGGT